MATACPQAKPTVTLCRAACAASGRQSKTLVIGMPEFARLATALSARTGVPATKRATLDACTARA
eukprot:509550-Alexandrium_andersonii.AAC.1